MLYAGKLPQWDMSRVRPAGARLKTFGGRASGPEPLEDLFRFCVNIFQKAAGRKLTSIECEEHIKNELKINVLLRYNDLLKPIFQKFNFNIYK